MIETWFKRGAVAALLAVMLGCGGGGGSKQFSPAAVPIAVKLRDAVNASNTSDMAGEIESARQLYSTRAITKSDLERFILIKQLGDGNSWNDAKKILEEGLAGAQ
jgi:hypothetical protein